MPSRQNADTLSGGAMPARGATPTNGGAAVSPAAGISGTVLDDIAVDQGAIAKKAAALFDLRLSAKKKALLAAVLAGVILLSYCIGRYSSDIAEIVQGTINHFQVLFANLSAGMHLEFFDAAGAFDPHWVDATYVASNEALDTALFNIRIPRIIVVLLVGGALAMAGASYQGMFKNPLVSPDLLGASAGASFGACLAMLLNCPSLMIQAFAFAGGMIAVACVVLLNKTIRADAILGLILGGILVSTLFQSGTSIIKLVADADNKLPAITFWLMGSFAGISLKDLLLALPLMIAGFAMLMSQRWKLNVLSFGEEEARSLGINTRRTRLIVIFAATLLSSSSVAIAGVIGWIGLVVPHLARAIVGPNYRLLLPTTLIVGAVFLLLVDNVARCIYSVEIPIGLLTSILGVPFFIFIYRKNMRGW